MESLLRWSVLAARNTTTSTLRAADVVCVVVPQRTSHEATRGVNLFILFQRSILFAISFCYSVSFCVALGNLRVLIR
jgi:hypothetical protein